MIISQTIFRAYDVRGIYPEQLSDEAALKIGKAFGTLLKRRQQGSAENTAGGGPNVVVGKDSRKSSDKVAENFINGLLSVGINVTYTGMSLTPQIHYLTCVGDSDGGVEVTAGHNPPEYNGFRLDYKDATPPSPQDIQQMYKMVKDEDFDSADTAGTFVEKDLFDLYLNHLKRHFIFNQSVKVVINCGDGTISQFAEKIFKEVGAGFEMTYCRLDNSFPLGIPDPERKSFLENLKKDVVNHNADVGFTFDEDCDRFGVVDEKGNAYENDHALLLFSKELLKNKPNAKIIYDVKSSELVEKFVKEWGGVPKMVKTGHTFVVEEMKKGADLGGEYSGHMYFGNSNFGYDDGIFAACKLLEILIKEQKPLSELMSEFPKKSGTNELKLNCPDDKKFAVVEEIKQKILKENLDVITIDGVRVSLTPTGWFLIRASNTSPYLSVRAEGKDNVELKLLLQAAQDILKSYNFVETQNLLQAFPAVDVKE